MDVVVGYWLEKECWDAGDLMVKLYRIVGEPMEKQWSNIFEITSRPRKDNSSKT